MKRDRHDMGGESNQGVGHEGCFGVMTELKNRSIFALKLCTSSDRNDLRTETRRGQLVGELETGDR